jgi:transcriptional regulator with XRE-family HTH domain
MNEQMTFAAWLKIARTRQGLTQEELADRSGFDDSYVNKVEKGHIKLPTYETRQRIHHALGTNEDDLITLGIVRDPLHGSYQRTTPERPVRNVEEAVPLVAMDIEGVAMALAKLAATLNDQQKHLFMDVAASLVKISEVAPTTAERQLDLRPLRWLSRGRHPQADKAVVPESRRGKGLEGQDEPRAADGRVYRSYQRKGRGLPSKMDRWSTRARQEQYDPHLPPVPRKVDHPARLRPSRPDDAGSASCPTSNGSSRSQ